MGADADVLKDGYILIVEDSSTEAETLEYILKLSKHKVSVAHSCEEALVLLREQKPALVISDIVMPGMNGYELCQKIKTDADLKDITVILLTQLFDPSDVIRGLECEADNFIMKPYASEFLLSRIKNILETKKELKGKAGNEILVVEDSPTQAELIKHLLKKQNYEVTVCANGSEALEFMHKQKPSLVISDILMPVMDGHELCNVIKNDAALKDIPVILLTVLSDMAEINKGFKLGADAYLTKPYNEEYLLSKIKDFMAPATYKTEGKTIEVSYGRDRYRITSDSRRLLNFLISTYESAIQQSRELSKAQMELRRLNENLEQRVRDRTSALKVEIQEQKRLKEQLLQSQKMEAVGQLAGGIAHDFNNILTAIIGYSNILQMKMKDNDPLKTYLEQILMSAERAATLTQGLLAFGRKQLSNPRPIGLNNIVKHIEQLLLRLIGEDIELNTLLAVEDLVIMADQGQIEQVLLNLATNARAAMPDGGRIIIETMQAEINNNFIRANSFGKPGQYALLSFTDTGIGIDEDTLKRIFEPFFTTKEIGKGTGLGLSIVYGIIKQHKGYITAHSTPGKGASFAIYLPLAHTHVEETTQAVHTVPLRGTETILLAEDDIGVRRLTSEVLQEFGYKVITSVDGDDAIRKFIENRDTIELVILDVIMPNKNGKEAFIEIKKTRPDIKALFTSGYTSDVINNKRGIIDESLNFLPKPASPNELLRKVREVLDAGPCV